MRTGRHLLLSWLLIVGLLASGLAPLLALGSTSACAMKCARKTGCCCQGKAGGSGWRVAAVSCPGGCRIAVGLAVAAPDSLAPVAVAWSMALAVWLCVSAMAVRSGCVVLGWVLYQRPPPVCAC